MRVNHWNEYPFVRVLFAFLAGILLYIVARIHIPLGVLAIFCLLTFIAHFLPKGKAIHSSIYSMVSALLFQVTFLLAGSVLALQKTDWNNQHHFTHFDLTATWVMVRITEPVAEKEKSFKASAEVLKIGKENKHWDTFGKTIIYFKKDSAVANLRYGDLLVVKNNFDLISPPRNPDEFNYKQFLLNKGICKTAYIQPFQWQILPGRVLNPLFQFTYTLRDFSLDAFTKYIPSHREAAVDQALVIGYRDDMSVETLQSYTAAGVVHVLAVSGLHVGILFAFLHQLLFFLNKKKKGKITQSVIIIAIIWMFALLTGLSGSVVRSATMFSIVTIGKNLKRTINMNNMLASSALVILMFNPMLITDIGFQLSYVAVFGITSLSSYIDNWFNRENKIMDHIWKMISMSLAAQIATLPITCFYFNQFPSYFLLANLFAIPIAALILHLGIALIIFQFLPPVAWLIGKITWLLTYSLNEYIMRIQAMPFSVLQLPSITLIQTTLLAVVIIWLTFYFIKIDKRCLFMGLIALLVILCLNCIFSIKQQNKSVLTVYSLKEKSAIEFRSGNEAILFTEGSPITSSEYLYLKRHWQLNNVNATVKQFSIDNNNYHLRNCLVHDSGLFQFKNYSLAVIDKAIPGKASSHPYHINALVISGNPSLNIKDLVEHYHPEVIVFSSNNSHYRVKKWKKDASIFKLATYDISQEGAFIKEI